MIPKNRISELLDEIDGKKKELLKEYDKLKKKYDFSFEKGRIRFTEGAKNYQKKFKIPLPKYLSRPWIRHALSIPFIYGMIIPAVILDVFLFIYQNTALRLYGVPLVKRRDYLVLDRKHLAYLNLIQKFNCIYCSYVNGLFSFAVEVAGRTEKYWCPIKAARAKPWEHAWEKHFADYGDPKQFKKSFNNNKEFFQWKKKKSS